MMMTIDVVAVAASSSRMMIMCDDDRWSLMKMAVVAGLSLVPMLRVYPYRGLRLIRPSVCKTIQSRARASEWPLARSRVLASFGERSPNVAPQRASGSGARFV